MTDQEILTKAIAKARKYGFNFAKWFQDHECSSVPKFILQGNIYKLLLTDHAFCKAFWGEGKKERYTYDGRKYIFVYDNMRNFTPRWKYYLPLMVITDNWLQYIKQFLERL